MDNTAGRGTATVRAIPDMIPEYMDELNFDSREYRDVIQPSLGVLK